MRIKKYVVPLLVLACTALMPKAGFAAFTSISRSTMPASVSFTGTGSVSINPVIKLASNPIGSVVQSSITWSGVSIGATQWKLSDDVIVLTSTITASNGGVQIYTDNTGSQGGTSESGSFTYTGSASSDPAGLVNANNPSAQPLSMAWSIKTATKTIEGGTDQTGVGAADPNNGSTAAVFNNKFQWLFFKDQKTPAIGANPAFSNGEDYVISLDFRGVHAVQGAEDTNPIYTSRSNSAGGSQQFFPVPTVTTSYIYPEANFGPAVTPASYGTKTLRLEAFTQ
jgi:hypothetical protein